MLSLRTVAFLFCLVYPAGIDDQPWPVERGPSREPVPYNYDRKAPVEKAFLEDAPACILYSGLTYLVEEDGTLETIAHEVTRVNSRRAVDRVGEYRSISWNPAWQKLILNEARVLKPDGTVLAVEARHVQVRDSNTNYYSYDRDKQLVISFPNLEIGDTIEVKWTTRGKNPEFAGKFFTRAIFGDDHYPTVREELRVRVPKTMNLKFATVNGRLEPVIQDEDEGEGATRLYQWTNVKQAELPADDNLPSKETLRLEVACSTFGTWSEVGQWKRGLRDQCWDCTPAVKEVVRAVTRHLCEPIAKARALTYWVRKHIRYVSISATGAGYTPQLPGQVLSNLYGDCKDQSQLLAVMLREAGLHPELVTLGTLDDGQIIPEVPMPWGTHAIVLLTIDGRQHWIDTTVANVAWDALPRDDRDRLAYVTDEAGIRLLRTPPLSPGDNRSELTTTVQVLTDGTTVCRRQALYHGLSAMAQRDNWFETAPSERRRQVAAELQEADGRTRLHWLKIDEQSLLDWDGPVRAELEFAIDGQFSGGTDKEASLTDNKVWSRLLSCTLDHERTVPLDLGTPFESIHRYVIQLPAAYRFDSLPHAKQVISQWGWFNLQVKPDAKDARRLELIFHTKIIRPIVQPADFAAFRRFHEEVHQAWRAWLSLTPTQDAGDVGLLAVNFLLAPGDSVSAMALVQLLRDSERQQVAGRVLRAARAFRPQDAGLWELAVKLAPAVEDVERIYAAMVRQFPDQPRYGVQLGAVRIQLGDHAGAEAVLTPLTRTAPDGLKAQAYLELSRSLLAQGKPDAAMLTLLAARVAGAETNRGLQVALLQGEIHERLKEQAEAVDSYRKALKLEADNEKALAALVQLELAAGNRTEAVAYLRRYTVAVGDDREGLTQAATWSWQLGRTEEALDLALRAATHPINASTQRLLGLIYAQQRLLGLIYAQRGEAAKAVLHLSQAEADAEVLLGLLRGNLALGNLREALEISEQCGPFKDGSAPLRDLTFTIQRLAERRAAYLKDLSDFPVTPREKQAWTEAIDAFLCAELAHRQGQALARVEELLAVALAQPVRCAPALGLRGLLQLERGKLSKAVADAEAALASDPSEPLAYLVRGRVRLEREDREALADLTRAAELTQRRDGRILHWLSAAQLQAGQLAKALATQGEAAMLLPTDAEVREQLRALQKAVR